MVYRHALIKDNLVHAALMKYMCIRCMLMVWGCSHALFTVYPNPFCDSVTGPFYYVAIY